MRRVYLRGHTNILKRLLIHSGGFNLGLLVRQLIGVGTPRGLAGAAQGGPGRASGTDWVAQGACHTYRRPLRQDSLLQRRSIARSGVIHIGVLEMVFTTGC